MKLKIKNYKCIDNLDFELEDNKLNFIYGVSGSGKTSISEIIKGHLENTPSIKEEMNKKVDTTENMEISIDKTNVSSINIFNENSIKNFIFDKEEDGLYHLIYKPSKQLEELNIKIDSFNKSDETKKIREALIMFKYNFQKLKDIGIKLTSKGKLSSNTTTKELCKKETFDIYSQYTNSQIKWLNEGISEELRFDLSKNKCPLCEGDLLEKRIKEIEALNSLKPDVINKMQNNINIFDDLRIENKNINTLEESKKFQEEVINLFPISQDVDNLLNMLDNNYSKQEDIKEVTIRDETQQYFLYNHKIDIRKVLEVINHEKNEYLQICKKYKGVFKSNVKNNISKINQELKKMNINYKIEKEVLEIVEDEYKIVHIKDKDKKDLSNNLSTGEKNIISLILFLSINNDNDIIIDDPASSFDEYKREKILEVIHEMRKKLNKFTLILSHDQIFLKFLLKKQSEDKKVYNWNSYIFENTTTHNIKKLEVEDMDTLSNHIIKRLNENITYEEKIINLRMYYEINKEKNENEYKYLSAILHKKSREEMLEDLISIGVKEEEILTKINKEFFSQKNQIKLPKYEKLDFENIYNEVSNFEKIFIKREEFNGEEKIIFSDVVHFNYGLVHMINPYKYNFQVKEIYELL